VARQGAGTQAKANQEDLALRLFSENLEVTTTSAKKSVRDFTAA
jgi:hypothetical protein